MALVLCPNCFNQATSFVANCPNCDFALSELFDHAHRLEYAVSPDTDRRILEYLAQGDIEEQRCVAGNPEAPIKCLDSLFEIDDEGVQMALAGNPSISVLQLEELLKIGNEPIVRKAIDHPKMRDKSLRIAAENTKISADLLIDIGNRNDYSAFSSVIRNPNIPVENLNDMLELLPSDKIGMIISSGRLSADHIVSRLPNFTVEKRLIIADTWPVPSEVSLALAEDSDERVRTKVAKSRAVYDNVQVAQKLIADTSKAVRVALAGNSYTPIEMQMELAKNADVEIARGIIYKDRSSSDEEIDYWVMDKLAKSADKGVRIEVASCSKTQPNIRWNLTKDPSPEVRKALTLRWKTAPWGLLEALTEDSDPSVAASARQYLSWSHDPWLNS